MPQLLCIFGFLLILLGGEVQAQILNADRYGAKLDSTKPFKAVVDIGFGLNKQLTFLLTADTKVDLSYFYKKSLFVVVGQYKFIQSSGRDLLHNGFAHTRARLFKDHWVHPEFFGQYQSDGVRGLEQRVLGGANARFILKEYEQGSWHVGLGAMYEYERWNYSAVPDHLERPAALPLHLHYLKLNTYLSFTQRVQQWLYVQVTAYFQARPDRYFVYPRLALNGKLSFQITQHLEFSVVYNLFHDSLPPVPMDRLFFSVTNKLAFRF